MAALGMLVAWAGYSVALSGYAIVKGYNVTLAQLVNPVHQYTWPAGGPGLMGPDMIFPNGKQATAAEGNDPAGTQQLQQEAGLA